MNSTLATFIRSSVWGASLSPADLDRVLTTARKVTVGPGDHITHAGDPADYWVGIMQGIVVQSVTGFDGKTAILTAACSGTWFGEGTVMKRAAWGYDAISRRDGALVLIPAATFHWLRRVSLPFNQFIASLLNHRLSHYMGLLANERLTHVEARMAHMLASLFDPELYPNRGATLRINQTDIALLAGLSRQRANSALGTLQAQGLVEAGRSGVTVLDLEGLRTYGSVHP